MSSSNATKRNTSSNEETHAAGASPSITDTNTPNDAHSHEEPKCADGARRESTDSDLMTSAHFSVDRSGAKVRTICTRDHEDGETCSHTVCERRYGNIPRVDRPSEKITVGGVEAMMESDARVEREGDGEGEEEWVVIGRD
ncbi:hypothetical protein MBLNU13_g01002t1 [Cladosporium sp. NU13]